MYCIVPLAGPDFYNERYGIKPLHKIDGEPLIKKAIYSRNWFINGELKPDKIVFVLRESPQSETVRDFLKATFSGCKVVLISQFTRGAVLSSLAGTSLVENYAESIVVDLVDIIYESDFNVGKIFSEDKRIGGILPYFKSSNEKFSYLIIEEEFVVKTVEKKVVSDNASAGTYFFRNLPVLLGAFKDSIAFENDYSVRGNLFLCPTFNGIIKDGMFVKPVEVKGQREVSLCFHA